MIDSALALVFSGLSALAAVGALIFVGAQAREATRANAILAAQTFVAESRNLWAECATTAASPKIQTHEFELCVGNILAHFELFSIFSTTNALTPKLKELVDETIVSYIDEMSRQTGYGEIIRELTKSSRVCQNLKDLCLQHRLELRSAKAVFEMLNLPRASL